MRLTFLSLATILAFTSTAANAQSNPLGDLLGGVVRGAMQDSAKRQAQSEWAKVDPNLVACLTRNVSPPPQKLAETGVLPSDPRLQSHVNRCRQEFAAEQQKKEAAESERLRREEQARRDEQNRQEARRREEEAVSRLKDEVSALRADAAIKPLLVRDPATVTLLIGSKDTATMTRDLDGAPRFAKPPEVCQVSNVAPVQDSAFAAYIRSTAQQKLRTSFHDRTCQVSELGARDVIMVSGPQLDAASLEVQLGYLKAVKNKQYVPFLVLTAKDFADAQMKRKGAVAAVERQIAAGEDVYALIYGATPVRSLCVLGGEHAEPLAEVFRSRRMEWADVIQPAPIQLRTANDADSAFVGLKKGDCGALLLAPSAARTVLDGLRRDGSKGDLHPVTITGVEIASKLVEQKDKKAAEERRLAEEQRTREEAAQKAEDERKRVEAERNRCRTKAVANNYFIAACVAAGGEGRNGDDPVNSQRKMDAERAKLSDCPVDVLESVARAGRHSARQAVVNVSPLVVFHDGLALQCKKIAATTLP